MDDASRRRPRVLLGVTGSVAAIKTWQLVEQLQQFADVKVVATAASLHFLDSIQPAPPPAVAAVGILTDKDDWTSWRSKGDAVLHIELRRWADLFVVAPLSANSLAKMAHGLCDNLVTCVGRAWDFSRPLLVAPAMNTLMWQSPFTEQHLTVLRTLGASVVPPVSKALACGDVGIGAMASPEDIAAACRQALAQAATSSLSNGGAQL